MTDTAPRRSVLLIDIGGPRSLAEVQPYLRRIFSDPCIMPGNAVKRWLLSRLIARQLAPRSRQRYASIGGKSDAVENAQTLASQLIGYFGQRDVQIDCAVATRYSKPDVKQGLTSLRRNGSHPVTPVYLFPHETSAVTGSCESALVRAAAKLGIPIERGVRHLGMTQAYTLGWAEAINQAVRRPDESFVIFSAHSLPLSIVRRGDPYVTQVEQSVKQIRALIGDLAGALAYQSQEADDWLGPSVEQAAAQAHQQGYRDLIVAPLSFFSDNTETLVDLDQDLHQAVQRLGFNRFVRLQTPNQRGFVCKMVAEALCAEWGLER
jgi:ferrochelatase